MWCAQRARKAVVQTKWFGLVGSRGADNGSTVWLKCLWCQWLCQKLRLADPKWRNAESPAGACHATKKRLFVHFLSCQWRSGWDERERRWVAPANLPPFYFFLWVKGEKSLRVSLDCCSPVWFHPAGGIEMCEPSEGPGSSFWAETKVTGRGGGTKTMKY